MESYRVATAVQTTRANEYVSRLWNGESENPCIVRSNCINDSALYKWSEGACSGQSYGTLLQTSPGN